MFVDASDVRKRSQQASQEAVDRKSDQTKRKKSDSPVDDSITARCATGVVCTNDEGVNAEAAAAKVERVARVNFIFEVVLL